MLAMVAHLSADEAWAMVSGEARPALGRPEVTRGARIRGPISSPSPAPTSTSALSMASEDRVVCTGAGSWPAPPWSGGCSPDPVRSPYQRPAARPRGPGQPNKGNIA